MRPVRSLGLGIDEIEPGDGLVRLLVVVLRGDLDELLGRVRREETPPFVTGDEGVPCGCAYRSKINKCNRKQDGFVRKLPRGSM